MNVVYLIEFVDRKLANEKPYYYVGSKSNCVLENGIMYGRYNKEYWGSSEDKNMKSLIPVEKKCVHILFSHDDYNTCLEMERTIHIERDVVANPIYFNKSIALCNNYSNPKYATYKHTETGKVARLERTHEKVLSGEWVGVTKGEVYSEERRMKSSMPGENHPLYGKPCSDERRDRISKAHLKNHEEDPEKYAALYKQLGELTSAKTKGVKQDPSVVENRTAKIKNNVVMRNKNTGELYTLKNTSEEYKNLDKTLWENFRTGRTQLKNIETGVVKDFVIDSDEFRNIDRTLWVNTSKDHLCLRNMLTGDIKYFCKTSDEFNNVDKAVWKPIGFGKSVLKNRVTKEIKTFDKTSDEFKQLDRTIWVGVLFNTVKLVNVETGISKRFEKDTEEFNLIDMSVWIWPTQIAKKHKGKETNEN